jgi:hypothetical protein
MNDYPKGLRIQVNDGAYIDINDSSVSFYNYTDE